MVGVSSFRAGGYPPTLAETGFPENPGNLGSLSSKAEE
jgi:hypothetical protein